MPHDIQTCRDLCDHWLAMARDFIAAGNAVFARKAVRFATRWDTRANAAAQSIAQSQPNESER